MTVHTDRTPDIPRHAPTARDSRHILHRHRILQYDERHDDRQADTDARDDLQPFLRRERDGIRKARIEQGVAESAEGEACPCDGSDDVEAGVDLSSWLSALSLIASVRCA
jgi:hypothetical protein